MVTDTECVRSRLCEWTLILPRANPFLDLCVIVQAQPRAVHVDLFVPGKRKRTTRSRTKGFPCHREPIPCHCWAYTNALMGTGMKRTQAIRSQRSQLLQAMLLQS